MSLLMALEVDVHKKDQELETACCVMHAVNVEQITAPGPHLI